MRHAVATAARTFERTLTELGVSERQLGDPAEVGQRAALLAAAETLWQRQVGLLLDGRQVRELLGVASRQAVSQLVKRKRLLALPRRDGRLSFPAFQFSPNGKPYPAIAAILREFAPAKLSPYTVASWFASRQRLLAGATPAAWLRRGGEPQRAVEAARRAATRLAH